MTVESHIERFRRAVDAMHRAGQSERQIGQFMTAERSRYADMHILAMDAGGQEQAFIYLRVSNQIGAIFQERFVAEGIDLSKLIATNN